MSHEQAQRHHDIHHLGDEGRLWCWFDSRNNGDAVFLTSPSHRLWRFHLSDRDGTELETVRELVETFDYALTPDELRFLLDCVGSVETWQDHCPHDLARYGTVGVTC